MALKSFQIAVGTSNTDVIECPLTQSGMVALFISNVSGGASTYTVKVYKQSTGVTTTVASAVPIAANTVVGFPMPIALEASDKVIMTAPGTSILVASGSFQYSAAVPAAVGFSPIAAWSSIANYVKNDMVSHSNGNSYVASQPSLNQDPSSATAYWVRLAQRGAAGVGDLVSTNNLSDVTNAATALANLTALGQGKHTIVVPAGAMKARSTNGAAAGSIEMTTNKQMVVTLDFDTTTQEFAQFSIPMPKSWNNGTVSFKPVWSHAATTTNFGVVWALEAVAISDDDTLDASWGTAVTSTDTGGTTNDLYVGPESSAITIAGTPATGDVIFFQVKRVPADGSDTMAIDARLHAIVLFYTLSAATDA